MIAMEGVLLTDRELSLRLLEKQDKEALFDLLQEEEVTAPAGFLPPKTTGELETFWGELRQYNTAVAILLEGRCIGYFHVNRYRPDEEAFKAQNNVGISYVLGKAYWGQGYGTRTVTAMSAFLLERFDNLWADYFAGNEGSRRVLEKCGFVPMGEYDMVFDALGNEERHCFSMRLGRDLL